MKEMLGYKVFNPDWTCCGLKYEVGETYQVEGELKMCENGFHFCERAVDCFRFYDFDSNNKVAEVKAIGNILIDDRSTIGVFSANKSVTDKIVIVREVSWQEVLQLVNMGIDNTGFGNVGNHNIGNYNTGSYNRNSFNVGNYNKGSHNVGDYNSGDKNTGDNNRGDYNTGDWNISNRNTGMFNTIAPKIMMFNKETNLTYIEAQTIEGIGILNLAFKKVHDKPHYKTIPFENACKLMWSGFTYAEKEAVKAIPNFDKDIFLEITGIDVD